MYESQVFHPHMDVMMFHFQSQTGKQDYALKKARNIYSGADTDARKKDTETVVETYQNSLHRTL